MEPSPRTHPGSVPGCGPGSPHPSHLPSPTSSTITSTTSNGIIRPNYQPLTRSESNPYPTTFVQADTSSFKHVVQMLTGSPNSKPSNPIPPIKSSKSKPSKLYERRNTLKNNLRISPLLPGFGSGRNNTTSSENLSPSILDFPALVLSPVTPLIPDPFNRSPGIAVDKAAEEKAIAEKGFYLHPSPVTTPRDSEPRLLPLFPLTSPRLSSGSDPSSC